MDSAGLQHVTKNFTRITAQEAEALKQLSTQFPYSQLIHLLYSRAAQDLGYPNKADLLHQGAVYSSDRSRLKWVMTTTKQPVVEVITPKTVAPPKPTPAPTVAVAPKKVERTIEVTAQVKESTQVTLSGDALRNDIYIQLEKLKKSKHAFEVSVEEFQKSFALESAEAGTGKKTKVVKEVPDPLLEEIKSSKKKLKVENPKQKEQNEIIDQFIKTQPVIPKARTAVPANDLSEESSAFSEGIVSETLVDILLKQGKKEKAIEVLKKLIWKFPQKKAYFAAQIEGLKN